MQRGSCSTGVPVVNMPTAQALRDGDATKSTRPCCKALKTPRETRARPNQTGGNFDEKDRLRYVPNLPVGAPSRRADGPGGCVQRSPGYLAPRRVQPEWELFHQNGCEG